MKRRVASDLFRVLVGIIMGFCLSAVSTNHPVKARGPVRPQPLYHITQFSGGQAVRQYWVNNANWSFGIAGVGSDTIYVKDPVSGNDVYLSGNYVIEQYYP